MNKLDELIKKYSEKLDWLIGKSTIKVECLKTSIKDENADVSDVARQLHENLIGINVLRMVIEDLKELNNDN